MKIGGNLASSIIKALLHDVDEKDIVGIARTPSKITFSNIETRKGDYDEPAELEVAYKGIDVLLVVSSLSLPDQRVKQYENILKSALQNNVKKIVYTGIVGEPDKTAFGPIVASGRKAEEIFMNSGMDCVVGRNGLYLEPDLDYVDQYAEKGKIINSAGTGQCAYTSRNELAFAYKHMLLNSKHNGSTYNLVGDPVTQPQLAAFINEVFETGLSYQEVDSKEYLKQRKQELGDFYGGIVGGIYESIRLGLFNPVSDYEKVTGRSHKRVKEMMIDYIKG